MARVKIRTSATAMQKIARRKKQDEGAREPGAIPPRLRGEFFTDSYAQLFEEEGKRLYADILTELVGGERLNDQGMSETVRGKLPELFEQAVARLTDTLKHKKGIDGLKDNAQFFAPWIKGLIDDVRATGMKEIMTSLEDLAHEHSVKVTDDSLLEQSLPDVEEDEPVLEDMALPEADDTPDIPDLSTEDVEGMLKGDDIPVGTVAMPPPSVAPAAPAPAGAAPGAPVAPILPAPQPAVAASTMKDVKRQLLARREKRQVVAVASREDLLSVATASLKRLDGATHG